MRLFFSVIFVVFSLFFLFTSAWKSERKREHGRRADYEKGREEEGKLDGTMGKMMRGEGDGSEIIRIMALCVWCVCE